MTSERVTARDEGAPTERVVKRDDRPKTHVDRGVGGVTAVIVGIAVLVLVAIVAFYLMNANRHSAMRTNVTTSAAAAVANSPDNAAPAPVNPR